MRDEVRDLVPRELDGQGGLVHVEGEPGVVAVEHTAGVNPGRSAAPPVLPRAVYHHRAVVHGLVESIEPREEVHALHMPGVAHLPGLGQLLAVLEVHPVHIGQDRVEGLQGADVSGELRLQVPAGLLLRDDVLMVPGGSAVELGRVPDEVLDDVYARIVCAVDLVPAVRYLERDPDRVGIRDLEPADLLVPVEYGDAVLKSDGLLPVPCELAVPDGHCAQMESPVVGIERLDGGRHAVEVS